MLRRAVQACENPPLSLPGVDVTNDLANDVTMSRMLFTNVSAVYWQGRYRRACKADVRANHVADRRVADGNHQAATSERA